MIILYKQFKRQFNEYILQIPNIGKKHGIIIILSSALKRPILIHLIKLQYQQWLDEGKKTVILYLQDLVNVVVPIGLQDTAAFHR